MKIPNIVKTPWYRQKKIQQSDNKIDLLHSWSAMVFKLSIAIGAFISWAFFSFYVNALPSLGNLGDITIYLIAISAWSFLIAVLLIAMTFASSFMIRYSSFYHTYSVKSIALYYPIFIFISAFILSLLALCESPQISWNIVLVLLFFIAPLFYAYSLTNKSRKNFDRIADIGVPLIFFSPIVFLIGYAIDTVLLHGLLQALFIILSIIFFAIWNLLIISEKKLTWQINLFIISSTLVILSITFTTAKISNPLIVSPFKLLQLGYYNAELHFKNEFMKESIPFKFNDNNESSNTFFILSSIGDEYILQETPQTYIDVKKDENTTIRVEQIDINGTSYWYQTNKDALLVWTDKNLTQQVDINISNNIQSKNERCESNQLKCSKIYRIKKENIAYEITGIDKDQSTVWEHNAKK